MRPKCLLFHAQVVERVLERLAADVNRDPACPVLGVVRLNGVVHAEERAAFREIARQLCSCAPALLFRALGFTHAEECAAFREIVRQLCTCAPALFLRFRVCMPRGEPAVPVRAMAVVSWRPVCWAGHACCCRIVTSD